jgi:hypothetical protein
MALDLQVCQDQSTPADMIEVSNAGIYASPWAIQNHLTSEQCSEHAAHKPLKDELKVKKAKKQKPA